MDSSTHCWCCPDCIQSNNSLKNGNLNNVSRDPLEHLVKVLRYHPSYLDSFLRAYSFLTQGDGPLSREFNTYIAMMASSRHNYTLLIETLCKDFSTFCSDEDWLMGLEKAPGKLQALDEINRLLAHQPWVFNCLHIEKLTKTPGCLWSISELTHALVLLAFYHSLTSLLCSCGIGMEPEVEICYKNSLKIKKKNKGSRGSREEEENFIKNSLSQDGDSPARSLTEKMEVKELLERMKGLKEEKVSRQERLRRFLSLEKQSAHLLRERGVKTPRESLFYTFQPEIGYQEFLAGNPQTHQQPESSPQQDFPRLLQQQDQKSPDISQSSLDPLSTDDFNWADQGYSLSCLYYQDVGDILDHKFSIARGLTYNTVGTKSNIDTTSFRQAVWNYTQCMYGIMHEEYNYNNINTLLDKNIKTYIKTVTCFPDLVTRKLYNDFMTGFLPSEKVHVNIMIHEAKFEAELLYGLKVLSLYMSKEE